MDAWDADRALASLTEEVKVMDDGETANTAARLLKQGLPGATQAIIHLALYSPSEKVRLDAAKTVLDRCLGTIHTALPLGANASQDPLERALTEIFTKHSS